MKDKDLLIKWAQAGDGDCMYKLATVYRAEGNRQNYIEWLSKSAETKNFDAMKEYADLISDTDREKALAIYKELAETFCDEDSMEKIVDMADNDKDTLNFILNLINNAYNEIYLIDRGNIFARMMVFQTRRHNECTWEYLQAIERRRIAARVRKLLSEN